MWTTFLFSMSIFDEYSFPITDIPSENFTIKFASFHNCYSSSTGAGILFNTNKLLIVRFCSFYNCSASGGGAIYTVQGITNISQICTENCTGRSWASDIIFYTPNKCYVKEVQSTSAKAGGHSFYVSGKSTDDDSFYVNTINISYSTITNGQTHYGIGITFWLYKDSLFSYIIISNSSSVNPI